MRRLGLAVAIAMMFAAAPGCGGGGSSTPGPPQARGTASPTGTPIPKSSPTPQASPTPGSLASLKHLIFFIQENRSFDSYFGTYPGADGFPNPLPCLPSVWYPSQCFTPFLNHADSNGGGPYNANFQLADIDNGKMDGFQIQAELEYQNQFGCPPPNARHGGPPPLVIDDDEEVGPHFTPCVPDVMGYHDGTDLPNYWAWAGAYTLQDHFFESTFSSSHPAHLELFSLWAAVCSQLSPPVVGSCRGNADPGNIWSKELPTPYLWTDLTYLMNKHGVTWKAYLDGGLGGLHGNSQVTTLWDVLPGFQTVQQDHQLPNAENYTDVNFLSDAANGTLPAVSWVLPNYNDSEHPQADVSAGEAYLTKMIDAVMAGPDWNNTAIFITHDDIAGFYDHVPPPYTFDNLGLGIRVPALIISPWVKRGYIDRQVCSTDCYAKLIEDDFMNGARLRSAGRLDPRIVYRDELPEYGNLVNDFDFQSPPRPALILRPYPLSKLRR